MLLYVPSWMLRLFGGEETEEEKDVDRREIEGKE